MPSPRVTCRQIEPGDRGAVVNLLESAWGTVLAARKGEVLDVSAYPGYVAEIDGALVGLAVSCVRGDEWRTPSCGDRLGIGR